MAFATGQVRSLSIFSTIAKVVVEDEDENQEELFQLFVDADGVVSDRVRQSMWVSLCREAILTGKRVSISTVDENSAVVASVALLN